MRWGPKSKDRCPSEKRGRHTEQHVEVRAQAGRLQAESGTDGRQSSEGGQTDEQSPSDPPERTVPDSTLISDI